MSWRARWKAARAAWDEPPPVEPSEYLHTITDLKGVLEAMVRDRKDARFTPSDALAILNALKRECKR